MRDVLSIQSHEAAPGKPRARNDVMTIVQP